MLPTIRLFNTLSGKEEILSTIEPNHLKIYVCGPTVYDRPHLGNARSIVIYDLLFRFAKKLFPKVTYVRNITDVDDKINAAAKAQGASILELTKKIIAFFYQDIGALNVLSPTFEPRATDHIAEMIAMIKRLIANGYAYESNGHVLFDVSSYKDYGALSNRHLDEMIAGARIEIADYKKNPLDFVLWKPGDADDDSSSLFESPWGLGRPGWHIECSAMSSKYLGEDFDIHGGGADLQFPHHENEIAQSRCANKGSSFAHLWVHNGFLTVNGEKMSKSLKNFVTVRDLLDQDIPGIVIRYLLLSTHYRKPFDFNQKALDDARKALEKFYAVFSEDEAEFFTKENLEKLDIEHGPSALILQHLANDLNTSKTIATLHEIIKGIRNTNDKNLKQELASILNFLGLFDAEFLPKKPTGIDEVYINSQIEMRAKFKQEKNFAKADEIRQNLLVQGIILEDIAGGKTLWKKK